MSMKVKKELWHVLNLHYFEKFFFIIQKKFRISFEDF